MDTTIKIVCGVCGSCTRKEGDVCTGCGTLFETRCDKPGCGWMSTNEEEHCTRCEVEVKVSTDQEVPEV